MYNLYLIHAHSIGKSHQMLLASLSWRMIERPCKAYSQHQGPLLLNGVGQYGHAMSLHSAGLCHSVTGLRCCCNRKAIAPLLRFTSSKSGEGITSLTEYIERAKPGQKSIYYIAADSLGAAASAPFVEQLIKKDLEVGDLTELPGNGVTYSLALCTVVFDTSCPCMSGVLCKGKLHSLVLFPAKHLGTRSVNCDLCAGAVPDRANR